MSCCNSNAHFAFENVEQTIDQYVRVPIRRSPCPSQRNGRHPRISIVLLYVRPNQPFRVFGSLAPRERDAPGGSLLGAFTYEVHLLVMAFQFGDRGVWQEHKNAAIEPDIEGGERRAGGWRRQSENEVGQIGGR